MVHCDLSVCIVQGYAASMVEIEVTAVALQLGVCHIVSSQ